MYQQMFPAVPLRVQLKLASGIEGFSDEVKILKEN
jgi:hypothetical protein